MDYLDPKKEIQERVLIMVGYILTAIAISMASLILLYQAYGFGIGKEGEVIRSSLTFFSSQPNPADIYIDGKLHKEKTNARFELPEGRYDVKLDRSGYKPWQHTIHIEGGKVEHFDYPLLVPEKLVTKKIDTFASAPALATQSLDRRWFLVNQGTAGLEFKVYDLKAKPLKPAEGFSLPANLLADAGASSRFELVEWADDNEHVLLKHVYEENKIEYVLINHAKPAESINLTKNLSLPVGELTLKNRKYDQYFLFDVTAGTLQSASLKDPLKPVLLNVLAFKSYSDDTLLYATNNGKPSEKVQVKLDIGKKSYKLKTFDPGSTFLLDLTTYSGDLFVVVGVPALNKAYVYKDPVGQLTEAPKSAVSPIQVMHVDKPNKLAFSSSAQFIMAENGQQFAVYDLENKKGYHYTTTHPMDAPQTSAKWMDGNRLTYVSNGKHIFFDYDYKNVQVMASSSPAYLPMFSQAYDFIYNLAPNSSAPATLDLTQTSLLTPEDQ